MFHWDWIRLETEILGKGGKEEEAAADKEREQENTKNYFFLMLWFFNVYQSQYSLGSLVFLMPQQCNTELQNAAAQKCHKLKSPCSPVFMLPCLCFSALGTPCPHVYWSLYHVCSVYSVSHCLNVHWSLWSQYLLVSMSTSLHVYSNLSGGFACLGCANPLPSSSWQKCLIGGAPRSFQSVHVTCRNCPIWGAPSLGYRAVVVIPVD